MKGKSYIGFVVREAADKKFVSGLEDLTVDNLPPGDVLVRVHYSSLNYKDMLSASGNRGVTKNYPHTPGIDAAGIVEQCTTADFKPGDEVIVTSYDLGMNTFGGLGEYIRVPASWVVKKPEGLSLRESMIFGTAGFTAALSILRLTDFGLDDKAEVLVTGSTGGVGSIAVSILSHCGYSVSALNGLNDEKEYLKGIGAKEVVEVQDFLDETGRPMLREKWDASVDSLGGNILTSAIRSVRADGAVTCCGNAVSHDISLTVYPFILRGVSLFGIDSQNCPMPRRVRAWNMMSKEWKFPWLETLASEINLNGVADEIARIRTGKNRGRIIVNLQG
ncbi:MAG TPA: YhdH/YhfP family quinone oxidoreductase [Spirochaetota bacterium]|nr:YhdH/YhfP family quinone oxidoreductase [Spirochaetota bacterium]